MKKNNKKKNQRGFTLLEYCAGAAVMIGVVYVALNTLGGNLSGLLEQLSLWSSRRSKAVEVINSSH